MLKRLLTAALAMTAAGAAGLVTAIPAHAATFQTTASNLNIRSDAYLSASVIKVLAGPTSVEVDCQRSGDSVTVPGRAATTWWAHLGAWRVRDRRLHRHPRHQAPRRTGLSARS